VLWRTDPHVRTSGIHVRPERGIDRMNRSRAYAFTLCAGPIPQPDRSLMNIALIGAGRAGGALVLAAHRSGHTIVSIRSRSIESTARFADLVTDDAGPPDLTVIAVRDDAIRAVASTLVDDRPSAVVHMSGAVHASALAMLADRGWMIGSWHPLQTLPTPEVGAERLAGSWVGVTAGEPLRSELHVFTTSLGCRPFDLRDEDKAAYHAAAAAAANFVVTSLSVAEQLAEQASVPFEAYRPLVDAIVENTFTLGAVRALTGPIARGDVATVTTHLATADAAGPELGAMFRAMARATAELAGAGPEMREAIG